MYLAEKLWQQMDMGKTCLTGTTEFWPTAMCFQCEVNMTAWLWYSGELIHQGFQASKPLINRCSSKPPTKQLKRSGGLSTPESGEHLPQNRTSHKSTKDAEKWTSGLNLHPRKPPNQSNTKSQLIKTKATNSNNQTQQNPPETNQKTSKKT